MIVFKLLRQYWRLIVVTAALVFIASVAVAVVSMPVYKGEVLVMFAASDQGNETLALLNSRIGGLAPLAGISGDVGGGRAEAIATLKSRRLSTSFIQDNNMLPDLFPEHWDADKEDWNVESASVPTMADAYERFDKDVRRVNEDRTTGMISVAILGPDRQKVAQWANGLVRAANDYLRNRAIDEARKSVGFLEEQLAKTTILEVRQAMNDLVEAQISKAALANTRDDYAFRVVDPAIEPEADEFVRPQRVLIVALGAVFGLACGFMLALLKDSWGELRPIVAGVPGDD